MLSTGYGCDLAIRNFDRELERLEALCLIDRNLDSSILLRDGFLSSNSRSCGHVGLFSSDLDAVGSSSLLQGILNRVGSHGHASLGINFSSRNLLTHQIRKRILSQNVRAEARSLIVNRSVDRSNHTILDSNIHGELIEALDSIRIGRNLRASSLQRSVDRLRGHGHAGLDINRSTGDILTDQCLEDRSVGNQIRAEARSLIVLDDLDRHDLSSVIDRDLNLHRAKAVDIIRVGRDNRLRIASSSSGSSKDRILIARSRRDTEGVLRISKNLGNSANKRAGRNRSAADGIHIIVQRVRIRSNRNELILEFRLANLSTQTSGLLQRTNKGLRDMAFGADADSDRDRSAIALRRSSQRIANNSTRGILTLEDLIQGATLGQAFIFNLSIFATRKHSIQRFHLGSELLGLDRALGHFVGHRQSDGSHKREHEETKRELKNITHYFLTSPKLLVPVTRSISGDTTFISRIAKEHHSAGAFLPKRNQNRSRPQPRPKMILPLAVVGEVE